MAKMAAVCILIMLVQVVAVWGHGYLYDPPSRSTMWRWGFDVPTNYNDNQLNCGGYSNEYYLNHGKCGVCGDPWDEPQPRRNEAGGKYGKGVISRTYMEGEVVDIKVVITANHLGIFEFRVCPNNNPKKIVTQECLDQHVLEMADGSGSRFELHERTGKISVPVRLPPGLTCSQCVLQWKWHVGNNFGTDPDGHSCKGCGNQEEFYGCADIAITASGQTPPPVQTRPSSKTPSTTQLPPWLMTSQSQRTPSTTTQAPLRISSQPPKPLSTSILPWWMTSQPSKPMSTSILPWWMTSQPPKAPSSSVLPWWMVTSHLPNTPSTVKLPWWMMTSQPPYRLSTTKMTSKTSGPQYQISTPSSKNCFAVNNWSGIPELDQWCVMHCSVRHCPPIYCACV